MHACRLHLHLHYAGVAMQVMVTNMLRHSVCNGLGALSVSSSNALSTVAHAQPLLCHKRAQIIHQSPVLGHSRLRSRGTSVSLLPCTISTGTACCASRSCCATAGSRGEKAPTCSHSYTVHARFVTWIAVLSCRSNTSESAEHSYVLAGLQSYCTCSYVLWQAAFDPRRPRGSQ